LLNLSLKTDLEWLEKTKETTETTETNLFIENVRYSPAYYYVPCHKTYPVEQKSDCETCEDLREMSEHSKHCCQCKHCGLVSFIGPHCSILSRSRFLIDPIVTLIHNYMEQSESQEEENFTRCLNHVFEQNLQNGKLSYESNSFDGHNFGFIFSRSSWGESYMKISN
jgi:hypothetical protein